MHEDILTARKLLEKAEKLVDPHAIEALVEEGRELLDGCLEDESLSAQDKELILRLKKSYARILFTKLEQLNAVNFESFRVFILSLMIGFHTEAKELMKDPVYEEKYRRLGEIFSEELTALGLAAESLKKNSINQSPP